jgi:hypothetical protein
MADGLDELTIADSMQVLDDMKGQSYIRARRATELVAPFGEHVSIDFTGEMLDREVDGDEMDGMMALSHAIGDRQRQARDARGLANVFPNIPIVTVNDVSESIVEALGGDPSEATMAGYGSTDDVRHGKNMSTLRSMLKRLGVPEYARKGNPLAECDNCEAKFEGDTNGQDGEPKYCPECAQKAAESALSGSEVSPDGL